MNRAWTLHEWWQWIGAEQSGSTHQNSTHLKTGFHWGLTLALKHSRFQVSPFGIMIFRCLHQLHCVSSSRMLRLLPYRWAFADSVALACLVDFTWHVWSLAFDPSWPYSELCLCSTEPGGEWWNDQIYLRWQFRCSGFFCDSVNSVLLFLALLKSHKMSLSVLL